MLEEFKAIRKRFPNAAARLSQHHPQYGLEPPYKEQSKCQGTVQTGQGAGKRVEIRLLMFPVQE